MSANLAEQWLEGVKKPWVLIDQVVECTFDQITCTKHVSSSDLFLVGHFPAASVYPGVLLLEGLRQAADLLLARNGAGAAAPRLMEARFLAPVLPGHTVVYTVSATETGAVGEWRVNGRGRVGEQEVVRATLHFRTMGPNGAEERRGQR